MSDLVIGEGELAGKGVYAGRDFEEGELVVPYNLTELSPDDFTSLPEGEWEWTHSFGGKVFLFPEPARYVNNGENPNTYPDFEKMGDFALRAIKSGEAITIDDSLELQYELDTFVKAYEEAANSLDFDNVARLVSADATFWFTNGRTFDGRDAAKKAFEATWARIKDETYTISDIEWIVASYWNSVFSYKFKSEGMVEGKPQTYQGLGTNVLARINGNWQITHEHLSMS